MLCLHTILKNTMQIAVMFSAVVHSNPLGVFCPRAYNSFVSSGTFVPEDVFAGLRVSWGAFCVPGRHKHTILRQVLDLVKGLGFVLS